MDQRIIDTAQKYRQMADALEGLDAGEALDTTIEPEVRSALLVLTAKALESRIEKCDALLTEDTGEAAIDALWEASRAVDKAVKTAMDKIAGYQQEDKAFEKQLGRVSVSTDTDSAYIKLLKLYKCESIIAAAYRYASAHSYSSAPEEFIKRHMDIDIEALVDIEKTCLRKLAMRLKKNKRAKFCSKN